MNQNQTVRISDKTLRITLIVGSVLLAVTILILSIAVGAAQQKEDLALTTGGKTLATVQTTPPSTETGTKPEPARQELRLTRPVEGYLAAVHDTQTLSYSLTMQDYRTHTGIDIEAEQGAAVLAAASGTVLRTYVDPLMGYTIEIDHGDGYVSVYKNLDETLPEGLEAGTYVMGGQLIGAVGDSALIEQAELPHLHFELMQNDVSIDPLTYLAYEERVEE